MRILPVLLNFNNVSTLFNSTAFSGKKGLKSVSGVQNDSFVKREDNYTKTYKSIVLEAYRAHRKDSSAKLNSSDVKFLLDIKDYDKFKDIISTPVEVSKRGGDTEETNIFFFTDENATRQLAKRLNSNGDRAVLKKLLSCKDSYSRNTIFHQIAKDDDVKKAHALKDSLSVKEFKRFMQGTNLYYETPYSIAKENNGRLKSFLEPLFEEESLEN